MAKVLCIDDEDDLRYEVAELMRDLGFEVVEAENGKAGLAAILEHRPALVVCDRMMPEMSGTELLETLRTQHSEFDGTPFIFMTALADRRDRHAVTDLYPSAYMTKPLDFEELEAVVAKLIGQVH